MCDLPLTLQPATNQGCRKLSEIIRPIVPSQHPARALARLASPRQGKARQGMAGMLVLVITAAVRPEPLFRKLVRKQWFKFCCTQNREMCKGEIGTHTNSHTHVHAQLQNNTRTTRVPSASSPNTQRWNSSKLVVGHAHRSMTTTDNSCTDGCATGIKTTCPTTSKTRWPGCDFV